MQSELCSCHAGAVELVLNLFYGLEINPTTNGAELESLACSARPSLLGKKSCQFEAKIWRYHLYYGSGPFVDEMALSWDCPNAIQALLVMVNASGVFMKWL